MDNQINPEEFTVLQDSPNETVKMEKQIKLFKIVILIAGVTIVVIIAFAFANHNNLIFIKRKEDNE